MKRTKGNRGSKIFATLIAFVMAFCTLLGNASDAWAAVTKFTTVSSDSFSTSATSNSDNDIEVFFTTDDFELSEATFSRTSSNWKRSTTKKFTWGSTAAENQTGIVYWDGFSKSNTDISTVSSSTTTADDGVTGTVTLNGEQFSLKWSDMAITTTGEKLDVELVVSDVTITYLAWGDESTDENNLPVTDCAVMFNRDNTLWFGAFVVCNDSDGDGLTYKISNYSPSKGGGSLFYGVTLNYTINFYDSSGNKYTEGNFDFFMTDIDVSDQIATYTDFINDGYTTEGTTEISDAAITGNYLTTGSRRAYDNRGGTYAESTSINDGCSKIYAITDTYLAIKNSRVYCDGPTFNDGDNLDRNAIHAVVSTSENSFSWSGSCCGSQLFDVDDLPTTIVITKEFDSTGEGYKDKTFTATVSFSDNTSQTVELTSSNNWTATISGITSDIAYTVSEINIPDGYECESITTTVKTVNDIETTYVTITNSYAASGSFTARATKVLSGRDLEKGEFTFLLTDADGNTVATATNGADGSVTFEEVEVKAAGTYTYYISEVVPSEDDEAYDSVITYDTHVATVTVTATDDGDGTLTCTVSYGTTDSTSNTFTNSVKTGNLTITKDFESTGEGYEDLEFTATVSFSDDTSQTVELTSSNDWTATISGITAGTSYTVTETDIPDGYTLVTSSDDLEGTIVADETSKVTITNSYSASGTWTPTASKKLSGGLDLDEGDYSFVVTDKSGETVLTGTNASATSEGLISSTAEASISFGSIKYNLSDVGTYTYYISEVVPSEDDEAYDEDITYDTTKHTVVVTVADNGDGTLAITAVYDDDSGATGVTFTNKYNHTSVLPETGSNGIFLGLAAAVVVLAVSCVAIKRRSGRAGSGSHFK